MGNKEDARDVSQDALIKIYKNLHKCTDPTGFKSWVYKIATNTCIDQLRKNKNSSNTSSLDETFQGEESEQKFQPVDTAPSPEETLLKKEHHAHIHKAISMLKPEHRIYIVLRDIQQLSYEEISDILNVPLGTVKSGLSRSRKAFKEIYVKLGF